MSSQTPPYLSFSSKINGFDDSYLSGTHFVSKDMSYDEIMYTLSRNPVTVSITFTEGMTYNDVKETLTDHGVQYNADRLDVLVDHPELFSEYDCVKNIPLTEDRQYALQGYLFPDTYFYDLNTDEKTILRRFLQNTDDRLLDEHYERAEAIGMTLDEVITLASIIQMESAIPWICIKFPEFFTIDWSMAINCNHVRQSIISAVSREKNQYLSCQKKIWRWIPHTIHTSMKVFHRDLFVHRA